MDSLAQPTCILVYIECNPAPGGSPFELSLGLRSNKSSPILPSLSESPSVVVCPRFALGRLSPCLVTTSGNLQLFWKSENTWCSDPVLLIVSDQSDILLLLIWQYWFVVSSETLAHQWFWLTWMSDNRYFYLAGFLLKLKFWDCMPDTSGQSLSWLSVKLIHLNRHYTWWPVCLIKADMLYIE